LSQKPGHGGLTWVFLQLILGFNRLGWKVLFLDRLEPEMCVDSGGKPCSLKESLNLRYMHQVMVQYGLGAGYAVAGDGYREFVGMTRSEVLERVREAELFVNVMGFFGDEEILAAARRRVFYDIDPGFTQMWQDLGLSDLLKGHDGFVTVAENLGHEDCTIPTCGREWIITRHSVVLDRWPARPPGGRNQFTDIGAWRGPYGSLEYKGRTYGLRAHEFRKFVQLPRLSGQSFEIACDIHPAEVKDLALLAENNWSLIDPKTVAADPAAYQAYLANSRAQFMVAKGIYVQSKSGLISDRCACYLATGRPVLAQDTGVDGIFPIGKGLLTFSDIEQAVAGVEEINRNYAQHCRAAREVAEECFDSDKVLTKLLRDLGSK